MHGMVDPIDEYAVQHLEIVRWEVAGVVVSSRLADSRRVHSITSECGWSATMGPIIVAQAVRDSSMTSNVASPRCPLLHFSRREESRHGGALAGDPTDGLAVQQLEKFDGRKTKSELSRGFRHTFHTNEEAPSLAS